MACGNGLNTTHGHRHHLAAGVLDALLHRGQVGIFARSGEQTASERATADDQLVVGTGRRNHDAW